MKLSLLVIVVLRLFALWCGVLFVFGLLTGLGMAGVLSSGGGADLLQLVVPLVKPVVHGIFAVVAWIFSESIARRVVGGIDVEVGLAQIQPENLYALGFLGVGLYHALVNLASTVNWLHYIVVNKAGQALVNGQDGLSLYEVTSVMFPCVAGTAVAMLSAKLGRRLARSIDAREAGSTINPG
jgi:hypothetical protein